MNELFLILNRFSTKQEKLLFILKCSSELVSKCVVRSQTRDGFNMLKVRVEDFSEVGCSYFSHLSRFTNTLRDECPFRKEFKFKFGVHGFNKGKYYLRDKALSDLKNKEHVLDDKKINSLFSYIKYSVGNCEEMAYLSAMFILYFMSIFRKNNYSKFFFLFEKYKVRFGYLENSDHAFIYFIDKGVNRDDNLIIIDPFFNLVLSEIEYKKFLKNNIDGRFINYKSIPRFSFQLKLDLSSERIIAYFCNKYDINKMVNAYYYNKWINKKT